MQGLFKPCGTVVRPFIDEEWMEPESGMDIRLFVESYNCFPFREMCGVGENPFDAMRTAVLQDFVDGILQAAVRQMGMGVIQGKHSLMSNE